LAASFTRQLSEEFVSVKPVIENQFEYPLELLWEYLLQQEDKTAYFVQEPTGEYILVSEQMASLFGISSQAIVGRTDVQLLGDDGSELDRIHQWIVANRLSVVDDLVRLELSRRGFVCLVVSKVPVLAKNRELIAVVGSYRLPRIPTGMTGSLRKIVCSLRFMRENLSHQYSATTFAEGAGVSVSILERRMKQIFGKTFGDYLINQRMVRGKDLLRYTSDGISLVAKACGYASNSSFTRQFNISVGMAPYEYREREYLRRKSH
jgi:AraC-like DNA-binding protein